MATKQAIGDPPDWVQPMFTQRYKPCLSRRDLMAARLLCEHKRSLTPTRAVELADALLAALDAPPPEGQP